MAKILIIEDNNDINEMLREVLEEEHQVFSAFSGTEGLMLFQQTEVDLILLDIMLPGKSGDQVLAEIRQTSQVPIIMLTALGEKRRISEYLLNGANDYLTKPFDLDEIQARITVQLRNIQPGAPSNKVLKHQSITMNEAEFSLETAEQKIRLGKKEFAIIKLLFEHPKQIFTKEQLYEKVWQETYFAGDNTLNAHLSNLRKKIAQIDAENEYIETIWGLGVRLAGTNV